MPTKTAQTSVEKYQQQDNPNLLKLNLKIPSLRQTSHRLHIRNLITV